MSRTTSSNSSIRDRKAITQAHITRKFGFEIVNDLLTKGYSIQDNFVHDKLSDLLIKEARVYGYSRLNDGELISGKNLSFRSDLMRFFTNDDEDLPFVSSLLFLLRNQVVDQLNRGFWTIREKTKHWNDEELVKAYPFWHGHLQLRPNSCGMFSCYPGHRRGHFKKHVDNNVLKSDDGRRITLIYYLNGDWEESQGGLIRLYLDPQAHDPLYDATENQVTKDIEPMANRLIAFWSDNVPHEVLEAYADRYAVSLWLKKDELKSSATNFVAPKRSISYEINRLVKLFDPRFNKRLAAM